MIIDINHDANFLKLKKYLFSFDFGCKDIIEHQMQCAIVKKEQSEYHVVYRFYVDASSHCLPKEYCGMPVSVEVSYGCENTHYFMLELYVVNRFIVEMRVYNMVPPYKLEMDKFFDGTPHYEKIV